MLCLCHSFHVSWGQNCTSSWDYRYGIVFQKSFAKKCGSMGKKHQAVTLQNLKSKFHNKITDTIYSDHIKHERGRSRSFGVGHCVLIPSSCPVGPLYEIIKLHSKFSVRGRKRQGRKKILPIHLPNLHKMNKSISF